MKFRMRSFLLVIGSVVVGDLLVSSILAYLADLNVFADLYPTAIYGDNGVAHKYSFLSCQLDFMLISFVRASVLVGAAVGVLVNRKDSPTAVSDGSTLTLCLFLSSLVYSPLKLLALSEIRDEFHLPWFWAVFLTNIGFSVVGALVWNYVLPNLMVPTKNKGESKRKTPTERVTRPESEEISTLVYNGFIENGNLMNGDSVAADEKSSKSSKSNGNATNVVEEEDKLTKKIVKSTALVFRLLTFCKLEWLWYSLGFLFLFLYSGVRIFVPYYTGRVISNIIVDRSYENLQSSVLFMVGLSLICSLFAGLRSGCFMYAITKVNTRIRSELFSSLVQQEIGFFDVTKTGDITSRLTSDCQTMSDTLATNVNTFLRSFIMLIGSLVIMLRLSWQMTTMIFIALPVIAVVSRVYGKYYDTLAQQGQDSLARSNEVADEVISSMRTVRSFANEADESRRYDVKLLDVLKIGMKKSIAYTGYTWINDMFDLLILVGVLWYGGHLVLTGRIKSDELIGYLLYQLQLGEVFFSLGTVYTGLMQAVGASRKVFELIDRKPKIVNNGSIVPAELHGKLEFRNVNFAYPTRPTFPVLENVNFTINAGEIVALVGPSGGGKSSCISLLEHFYEPQSGEVLLDGLSVNLFDHSYFHRKVALVGQEPVLYARPISENIAYGLNKSEFTDDSVEEAAKLANAHEFIAALPLAYQTDVGEKGVQISGGQKQRVAIARALIRSPKVLLLDEATSALDAESEFLVQQALYQNLSGRTVILIAHRLSTVEKANRIIVIDGGRVVQEGTHQQLLNVDGIYKNLVHRQLLANNDDDPAHSTSPLSSARYSDYASAVETQRDLKVSSFPFT